MDQSSAPWRVFDAPADGAAGGSTGQPGGAATRPAAATVAGLAANQGLAIAGIVGALAIGGLAILLAISGAGGETVAGPKTTSGVAASSDGEAALGQIVVDVTGAVATPGVYHLAGGSRIGDAIEAAGGFGPRVDVDRVATELNLAAALSDGDQVRVPSRDDPAPGGGGGTGGGTGSGGGGGGLVNLNTATQAELEALPGIGPVTAGKIIESRSGSPFKSVDDLRERGLVGEKTFDSLKALVTVG